MSRDVYKMLTTRQYYTAKNNFILKYPGLHCKAILDGFKTEGLSRLIEDILKARLSHYHLP